MTQQHSFFRTLPPSFYWKTVRKTERVRVSSFYFSAKCASRKIARIPSHPIRVREVPQYNDEYESKRKSQVDRLKLRHYYSLPNLMQK